MVAVLVVGLLLLLVLVRLAGTGGAGTGLVVAVMLVLVVVARFEVGPAFFFFVTPGVNTIQYVSGKNTLCVYRKAL